MKIHILSCAEQELAAAVDHYNGQRPGLGFEFAAEVQRTLDRIAHHPEAWPLFSRRSRRCLTDRFPYGILYRIWNDRIEVGAVMHLSRDPRRWQERFG